MDSETLVRSLFPTRARGSQAEREERKEHEGNDNEEE
jgi:hypothetical protein